MSRARAAAHHIPQITLPEMSVAKPSAVAARRVSSFPSHLTVLALNRRLQGKVIQNAIYMPDIMSWATSIQVHSALAPPTPLSPLAPIVPSNASRLADFTSVIDDRSTWIEVVDQALLDIDFDHTCFDGLDDQLLHCPRAAFAAMCWEEAVEDEFTQALSTPTASSFVSTLRQDAVEEHTLRMHIPTSPAFAATEWEEAVSESAIPRRNTTPTPRRPFADHALQPRYYEVSSGESESDSESEYSEECRTLEEGETPLSPLFDHANILAAHPVGDYSPVSTVFFLMSRTNPDERSPFQIEGRRDSRIFTPPQPKHDATTGIRFPTKPREYIFDPTDILNDGETSFIFMEPQFTKSDPSESVGFFPIPSFSPPLKTKPNRPNRLAAFVLKFPGLTGKSAILA